MTTTCLLETAGYTVGFQFESGISVEGYLRLTIMFRLHEKLGNIVLSSGRFELQRKDVQRLIQYFERHMVHLQANGEVSGRERMRAERSEIWVNADLDFELQAQAGEIDADGNGEFGLLFLLNLREGANTRAASGVYAGGSAVVSAENVRRFIGCLRSVLAALPSQDG